MRALVSIIIPFYNEERALPRCLDSVLAQTYRELEIILVDGASTDGSAGVCDRYAAMDKRIHIIRQPVRNGIAGGRNVGLAAAAGDYIQFVDADDLTPPDLTEALVRAMGDKQYGLAATGYEFVGMKNGRPYSEIRVPELLGEVTADDYVAHCSSGKKLWYDLIAALWCKLLRTDLIREHQITFDESAREGEDMPFMFRYLTFCGTVSVIHAPCYKWVVETPESSFEDLTAGNRYRPHILPAGIHNGKAFEDTFAPRLKPDAVNACRGRLANFIIIAMIIFCRRDATLSRREILTTLRNTVNSPMIREWFRNYQASPGESRIIPLLVKYRLALALSWLCRYKADKRYGKYYSENYRKNSNDQHNSHPS